MSAKSHLYFKNRQEGTVSYKARQRGGGGSAIRTDSCYPYMAAAFADSLRRFNQDLEIRHSGRVVDIPNHFDLIELEFFDRFDQPAFEGAYFEDFGLTLVHLRRFNRIGLFIISDIDKFNVFFTQIRVFIDNVNNTEETEYDAKIRFLNSFRLFRSDDMIGAVNSYDVLHLSLINTLLNEEFIYSQRNVLEDYLKEKGLDFKFDDGGLEIYNANEEILKEIVDNFDIIYATCSGSGTIVRPTAFNIPHKEYGFGILNADAVLPLIGVIDTGVSNNTPLAPILDVDADEYDLTLTGAFFDNADHGTAVACLAALGDRLIPGYRGQVECDAKILPIKISDGNRCALSQISIVNIIRHANVEKGVRIFTLTVGYTDFPLKDNQEFSSYALALDRLASELDILIFISTTNNLNDIDNNYAYPDRFLQENANIAPPAESMNNMTVGASNDNFEDNGASIRASGLNGFPAIYSRKFHYNKIDALSNSYCKHLLKPDILMPGGDYELDGDWCLCGENTSLEVLSSDLQERTIRYVGTSYSGPLAANLAARIIKRYPDINMQSVKAMMINAAIPPKLGDLFNNIDDCCKRRIVGHGIPDINRMLFSDDNQVTLLLEDSIQIGNAKSFKLNIPEYLNRSETRRSLLRITATLCFSFEPVENYQLIYCPYHIGFAIGKTVGLVGKTDRDGNEICNIASADIKLSSSSGSGWSQDYYNKAPLFSNTQKVQFSISRDKIIEEDNSFKVFVNSGFHKLLPVYLKDSLLSEINFALVVNIKQCPKQGENLDSLYDGLEAINDLETMAHIEADLEADLDA